MTPEEEISLHNLDKKVSLILQKLECLPDHEERLRVVEARTVAISVIFSFTSLVGIIAFIKAVFGL